MVEFIFGLCTGWATLAAVWLARRAWHQNQAVPAPGPPRSDAQRQNQAVTEANWAATPHVHSARFARHIRRGRRPPPLDKMN